MNMTDLSQAVRDYCSILWRLEIGDIDAEQDRQSKHAEVARILGCKKKNPYL